MPNSRRNFVPGGTYFFTVVTHQRRRIFDDLQAIQILGEILRDCQHKYPFQMNALVLLPEHLHAIWTLPRADDRYSMRWGWIKKEFTKRWIKIGGQVGNVSEGRDRERRLGVWQPRFWEHTIENDEDFDAHFDYVHFNPVKHGHVQCPSQWKTSSFHRWVNHGVYPADWGCGGFQQPDFSRIESVVGEIE